MLEDEPPAKRQALQHVSLALRNDQIDLLSLPEVPHTSEPEDRGDSTNQPKELEAAASVDRDQLQRSQAPCEVPEDNCEFVKPTPSLRVGRTLY